MNDALPSLLFPFKRGMIDTPRSGQRLLILGAAAGFRLPPEFSAELQLVQGFRPDFLALTKAGFPVTPLPEGDGYDGAFVLLGRHRRENSQRLSAALQCVRPGGLVIAAGMKKDGAQSVAKRMAHLLPLEEQLAKHHGVVFWLRRPAQLDEDVLAELSLPPLATTEGYATAAGSFSEGAVDPGSYLLAESLPGDISGAVADYAAGWGYLSLRLAERFSLATLDLYEAHHASLEAARQNLAVHAPGASCRFFWHDLLAETISHRYDAIVMNPPFHRSRAAEPDMGSAMVAAAAKALKPGGQLFLVANRGLPYEKVMEVAFARCGELVRSAGYKVLWAER
ncbi:class I SAM-dependent methyltransferase [Chelativorans sp. Marseille-P2723]|uniref:class I SAM-dependent methyltransferase n=1 Tax=Chelativorans sp. Marseille-P2723 TaxID=2709133 RepID=UPI00157077B0|nr:class I SAM-dependent methyltransferase [Chelativorans sp. Marseille-P2723]